MGRLWTPHVALLLPLAGRRQWEEEAEEERPHYLLLPPSPTYRKVHSAFWITGAG